jgi:hypothetical protein
MGSRGHRAAAQTMSKDIERRLQRLERLEESRHEDKRNSPRSLDSYFRALENLDREKAGLPPLPYTEEDRQDDEEFLRETLPTYRASPGWQTQEAQSVLNEWEKHTLHSLENGA